MFVANQAMDTPLVSICIISYNQAAYIRQAVDSTLHQQVNFSLEIIIADDYSTDGTKEIIVGYEKKNPGLIRILPRIANVGAAKNFTELLSAANGRYIAYLEGDDYWTDNDKLQQQIDILETNPGYVSCFTNVLETFSDEVNDARNYLQNGCFPKSVIGFNELIYKNYIQTCSVVFRNKLVTSFPDWYIKLKVGDWPLHLLLSQYGDSYYIHKVMALHRNHSMGTWSARTKLQRIYATLEVYDAIKENTGVTNSKHFRKAKSNLVLSAVKYCIQEKKIGDAIKNFVKGFLLYPKNLYEKKLPF